MKYLYKLFEYKKSQKYLYHICDFEKINYMLETGKLTSYRAGGDKISLTRDFLLDNYLGDSVNSVLKLVIDWDTLSNDYDTKEFIYKSQTGVSFDSEEEEQVQEK